MSCPLHITVPSKCRNFMRFRTSSIRLAASVLHQHVEWHYHVHSSLLLKDSPSIELQPDNKTQILISDSSKLALQRPSETIESMMAAHNRQRYPIECIVDSPGQAPAFCSMQSRDEASAASILARILWGIFVTVKDIASKALCGNRGALLQR